MRFADFRENESWIVDVIWERWKSTMDGFCTLFLSRCKAWSPV